MDPDVRQDDTEDVADGFARGNNGEGASPHATSDSFGRVATTD